MKKLTSLILGLFSILFLAGCGGGTPYSPIIEGTAAPDFAISIQSISPPPTIVGNVNQATKTRETAPNSATFTVTVKPLRGFTGTVNLSATNDQNNSAFTLQFQPSSVTLDGVDSATSQFIVSLPMSDTGIQTRTGQTFTFTVTGTSGTVRHSAATRVGVQVNPAEPPTFTVAVQEPSPTPVIFCLGVHSALSTRGFSPAPVSITVTIAPVNGFVGTVDLSAKSDQTSNPLSPSFSATSVSLDGTHSQNVTFTMSLDNQSTAPGTYSFAITGASGATSVTGATHATVDDDLPFLLTISPATVQTVNATPGQKATWTITVTGQGGFTGSVNLALNNPDTFDFSAILSQPSVSLTASHAQQTVTLTTDTLTALNNGDGGSITFGVDASCFTSYTTNVSAQENLLAF